MPIDFPLTFVDLAGKARVAELGYAVFASSRAEFGRYIADETDKWDRNDDWDSFSVARE